MRLRATLAAIALLLAGCQLAFTTVGSWTRLSTGPDVPGGASITALQDGRALVLGGVDLYTGQAVGQTLLFDAAANRWSQGAPLPEPRVGYAAVALTDGSLLVAGGVSSNGQAAAPLSSSWLYQPRRDAWQRAGDLQTGVLSPEAVRLTDGRVLLVGGSVLRQQAQPGESDPYQDFGGSEFFDPATRQWSSGGALPSAPHGMVLVALPHGLALAAGGCAGRGSAGQSNSQALSSAELFNPATRQWAPTASMPAGRCGGSGVLLADGRALVVGGSTPAANGLAPVLTASVFDPRTRSWEAAGSTAGSAVYSTSGPAPVLLKDGSVFLPAQQQGAQQGSVSTILLGGQLYLPAANVWRFVTTTSLPSVSRFGPSDPTAMALPSGGALVLLESDPLLFDPRSSPPAGEALDNVSLTWILLALAGGLAFALVIGYAYQRRFRREVLTE